MIDTIIVRIHSSRESIERGMKKEVVKYYNGAKLIFRKSHLKLIGGNSTKINFSLSKFIQENNVEDVPREKLNIGVDAFIELLNIPCNQILLSRVDVAHSFTMKHSAHHYMSKFDMLDRFDKILSTNGNIKYVNKNVTLSFYDKLLEMRQHRAAIPVQYKNLSNEILRYELQIRNKIKDVIKYDSREPLTILALKDDRFLDLLVESWFGYFKKVLTARVIDLNFIPSVELLQPKDFSKLLQYKGVQKYGAKNIEAFLKNDVRDAVVRSRIRKSIKNAKEFASTIESRKTKTDIRGFAIKVSSVYYKKLAHLYVC